MVNPINHQNPTRRRRAASQSAFSLVEVMVATLLAAILFTAVFSGISNSMALLNTSREKLRATQIIVSRMEGLRLMAWGSGTNQPSQIFNPSIMPTTFTDHFYPLGLNGDTNNLGAAYTGTITIITNQESLTNIEVMDTSYGNSMAFVTITVTWNDVIGHKTNVHTDTMSTYVSRYGMQNYIYTH
ncbi:MAG TPA: type II secretion system protein [Verrucomicrobiae bacterium]